MGLSCPKPIWCCYPAYPNPPFPTPFCFVVYRLYTFLTSLLSETYAIFRECFSHAQVFILPIKAKILRYLQMCLVLHCVVRHFCLLFLILKMFVALLGSCLVFCFISLMFGVIIYYTVAVAYSFRDSVFFNAKCINFGRFA